MARVARPAALQSGSRIGLGLQRSSPQTRSTLGGDVVAEAYNQSLGIALGRYVNLCQGRGKTPTHLTGGIFYQAEAGQPGIDPHHARYDYDYRVWGTPCWWQNTRFATTRCLRTATLTTSRPCSTCMLVRHAH